MKKKLVFLLLSLALSGCVSFQNITPASVQALKADEGIVIFGVGSNFKPVFHSGTVSRQGRFVADGFLPYGIAGKAENGYVIRKLSRLKNGRAYGLVFVDGPGLIGLYCSRRIAFFNVEPGKAQYFSDITVRSDGTRLYLDHEVQVERAREHFLKTYPGASVEVSQGKLAFLRDEDCSIRAPAIQVPIHVPSSR